MNGVPQFVLSVNNLSLTLSFFASSKALYCSFALRGVSSYMCSFSSFNLPWSPTLSPFSPIQSFCMLSFYSIHYFLCVLCKFAFQYAAFVCPGILNIFVQQEDSGWIYKRHRCWIDLENSCHVSMSLLGLRLCDSRPMGVFCCMWPDVMMHR